MILLIILIVAGAIMASVALDFYGALIFRCAWEWFVVPATGFPSINYWIALGLILTLSFLVSVIGITKRVKNDNEKFETVGELAVYLVTIVISEAIGMTIIFGIMALVQLGV